MTYETPTGANMFAYCMNNPELFIDYSGNRPIVSHTLKSETKLEKAQSFAYMNNSSTRKYCDLTDRLNLEMQKNSRTLFEYASSHDFLSTGLFFASKSFTGCEWDFKKSWGLDSETLYLYENTIYRYDSLGNIHYGYVGRAAFSEVLLLRMAGIVQIWEGTSKWDYADSYFDDPYDQEMIKYGFYLWNRK